MDICHTPKVVSTLQAAVAVAFAILPGAIYLFAFERQAGAYGLGFSDRFIRFVAASAVFHALFSALEYYLYRTYLASGDFVAGHAPLWLVPLVSAAYVVVPWLAGTLIAKLHVDGNRLVKWFTGESHEPRAWDYLWSQESLKLCRLRLRSGTWLAGYFGDVGKVRSYAAGYPEEGDLYLAKQVAVDAETGEFGSDENGKLKFIDSGLLIKWADIEYLDISEIVEE